MSCGVSPMCTSVIHTHCSSYVAALHTDEAPGLSAHFVLSCYIELSFYDATARSRTAAYHDYLSVMLVNDSERPYRIECASMSTWWNSAKYGCFDTIHKHSGSRHLPTSYLLARMHIHTQQNTHKWLQQLRTLPW
jgi:hypothetical protein